MLKTSRSPSEGLNSHPLCNPTCVCPLHLYPCAFNAVALSGVIFTCVASPRTINRSCFRVNIANSTPIFAVNADKSFIETSFFLTVTRLSYSGSLAKSVCCLADSFAPSMCKIALGRPCSVLRRPCSIGEFMLFLSTFINILSSPPEVKSFLGAYSLFWGSK